MKRLILVLAIACALVVAWQAGWLSVLTLDNLKAQQASLTAYRDQSPLGFSISFFIIYVVVVALSIPGAVIMTLAGGAFSGSTTN